MLYEERIIDRHLDFRQCEREIDAARRIRACRDVVDGAEHDMGKEDQPGRNLFSGPRFDRVFGACLVMATYVAIGVAGPTQAWWPKTSAWWPLPAFFAAWLIVTIVLRRRYPALARGMAIGLATSVVITVILIVFLLCLLIANLPKLMD